MKTWLLKKTGPLELLLAAIILVCVYFQHLQDVPFYPDESQWIATSFYFESLLGIKPSTPEWLQLYRSTSGYTNTNWAENYWTLTQPPVTRPQIAVILAVPFLFNRRRVWWWFCGGAAFLALYSLALVRFEGVRDFISLLRISAIGQGFGMNQNAMFNFTGMVLRLLPHADIDAVHVAAWGLFLAAVIGLSVWWKSSPEIHYHQIVLAVAICVFTTPHLHYHDLALLLIPRSWNGHCPGQGRQAGDPARRGSANAGFYYSALQRVLGPGLVHHPVSSYGGIARVGLAGRKVP